MNKLTLISILITLTTLIAQPSYANKVALVIGNSAYKQAPLTNPANDANDIATKLRRLNFEVI
ncbi:MAG: caspase family protein, partial [Methylococcales bacterium]|nr:caspase family protein [Methylococcales bacterium]